MAQVQRKRMLWYYSRIIDWMIANPGRPLYECAQYVGRTPNTLSIIINSDMFKAALAQRKNEFQMSHDFGIIQKTTQVAHGALDAILETLEKKRDKVPLERLESLADGALARLGYTAKPLPGTPSVTVIGQQTNQTVVLPVSQADLDEARMALRASQASHQRQLPRPKQEEALDVEATEVEPMLEEKVDASITSVD